MASNSTTRQRLQAKLQNRAVKEEPSSPQAPVAALDPALSPNAFSGDLPRDRMTGAADRPVQGSDEWNKMVFDELVREAEELEVVWETARHSQDIKDDDSAEPAVSHARHRRAMALFMLAGCYERGRGCLMSLDKAISHYHQAAELGLAQAQYELALCYIRGSGYLAADMQKGMCYLRQAAAQQMPEALYDLGCHYANGEGVEKDLHVARECFEKAIKKGNKEAVPALRRIIAITEGNVRRRSVAFLMLPTFIFMLFILYLNYLS